MLIHKQPLDRKYFNREFYLDLPKDSKIISFQKQRLEPTVWYMFDERNIADLVRRYFFIVGTGISANVREAIHIGTLQVGLFGFHLFEKVALMNGVFHD